jgi:hypothetical protein
LPSLVPAFLCLRDKRYQNPRFDRKACIAEDLLILIYELIEIETRKAPESFGTRPTRLFKEANRSPSGPGAGLSVLLPDGLGGCHAEQ